MSTGIDEKSQYCLRQHQNGACFFFGGRNNVLYKLNLQQLHVIYFIFWHFSCKRKCKDKYKTCYFPCEICQFTFLKLNHSCSGLFLYPKSKIVISRCYVNVFDIFSNRILWLVIMANTRWSTGSTSLFNNKIYLSQYHSAIILFNIANCFQSFGSWYKLINHFPIMLEKYLKHYTC